MSMPIDLPPKMIERFTCSVSAAVKYEIPANIILAIAEKEGGRPGQWVRNRNGTHDVGTLQFNTAYLAGLARYGIMPADVSAAGCFPYDLAAWRLRQHIRNDSGDLWTRAANYHSRTPSFNAIYRSDLKIRALRWADWLSARYKTRNLMAAETDLASSALLLQKSPTQPALVPRRLQTPQNGYVPRRLLRDEEH